MSRQLLMSSKGSLLEGGPLVLSGGLGAELEARGAGIEVSGVEAHIATLQH